MAYILLSEKFGKKRGFSRVVSKGEIVERIPGNSLESLKQNHHNYRVVSDPDTTFCVQQFNQVNQLERNEANYLGAIKDPHVRIHEYEDKIRLNEILDLRVHDVVIVNNGNGGESLPVHGRIEYIGPWREQKGTFFGINIALVSKVTACTFMFYSFIVYVQERVWVVRLYIMCGLPCSVVVVN